MREENGSGFYIFYVFSRRFLTGEALTALCVFVFVCDSFFFLFCDLEE